MVMDTKLCVSHHLADAGVTSEHIGVLNDGQSRGSCGSDLQHRPPFSKVCPVLLILSTTLVQPIQTCEHRQKLRFKKIPSSVKVHKIPI